MPFTLDRRLTLPVEGYSPGAGALEGEFCRLMRGSNHSFGLRIAAFEGRPFRRGVVRGGGFGIAGRSVDPFMKQAVRAHRGDRGGGSVCRGNRMCERNGESTGVGAARRGDRRIGRIGEKGEGGSDFRDFARMGNIVPRQTVLLLCFERRSRFRSSAAFGIRGPSSSAPSFGRDAARLSYTPPGITRWFVLRRSVARSWRPRRVGSGSGGLSGRARIGIPCRVSRFRRRFRSSVGSAFWHPYVNLLFISLEKVFTTWRTSCLASTRRARQAATHPTRTRSVRGLGGL